MTDEERARDPETPPKLLRRLAAEYPEAVLENPVLPLLEVGDWEAWASISLEARAALRTKRYGPASGPAELIEAGAEADRAVGPGQRNSPEWRLAYADARERLAERRASGRGPG